MDNPNTIYGDIDNNSDILIAIGTHNSIHGLLTNDNNRLSFTSLSKCEDPLLFTLSYNDTSFYLRNCDKFISMDDYAYLSNEKGNIKVTYSSIEDSKKIWAGALHSFSVDDREITWEMPGLPPADLVIFLPINWYEKDNPQRYHGIKPLLKKLKTPPFIGYTSIELSKIYKIDNSHNPIEDSTIGSDMIDSSANDNLSAILAIICVYIIVILMVTLLSSNI